MLGPDNAPGRADGDHRLRRVAVRRPLRARGPAARGADPRCRRSRSTSSTPSSATATCCVQICAQHRDTVVHTVRELLRTVRGALQLRWTHRRLPGRAPRAQPAQNSPRNLFAFRDGTGNPQTTDAALMNELVWAGDGRAGVGRRRHLPGRAHHPDARRVLGSRRAHRAAEHDRARPRQRRAAGRDRRVRGSALRPRPRRASASRSTRTSAWPTRARPPTANQRILRRGFSYPRGFDEAGQLDQGLLFVAYNRSPEPAVRGHPEPPQRRADDRLHHPDRRRLLLRPARGARRHRLRRQRPVRVTQTTLKVSAPAPWVPARMQRPAGDRSEAGRVGMFHARTSRSSSTPRLLLRPAGGRRRVRWPSRWRWPARRRPRPRPRAPIPGELMPRRRARGSTHRLRSPPRVADVIDHMSLDDEITMVEGHGTAPPNPYVFYMPGIPDLCIPQLGEEDGPGGRRRRAHRRHPAARRRRPGRHLRPVAGPPVRPGHRLRGVRQGRGGQPGPDGQHRPRPALGPLVRDVHRGPVPQRGPGRRPRSRACRAPARCRRSSTTPPTTRRPTATRPRMT